MLKCELTGLSSPMLTVTFICKVSHTSPLTSSITGAEYELALLVDYYGKKK
jgi:hypothetical protein